MKKILLLLICLISFNIIPDNLKVYYRSNPNYDGIHEEFRSYIIKFVESSEGVIKPADLSSLTMGFTEFGPDSRLAGLCFYSPFFQEIDIDKTWWNNHKDKLRREELIFHELGHCILHRMHTSPTQIPSLMAYLENLLFDLRILKDPGRLDDYCPKSYMHPVTISKNCILKHYNYYMRELFRSNNEY